MADLLVIEEKILGVKSSGTATEFQKRAVGFMAKYWRYCKDEVCITKFLSGHPELGTCVLLSADLLLHD